ncbi:MAG: hypothetical protein Q8R12_03825 [bacterium]|nr:hypothetical protein [bacterium]
MSEIIPAINADNFEAIKRRIKLVEPFTKWVHLDVADGTFTPNSIWHESKDLLTLETPLFVEVHLMISDMDIRWRDWVLPRVNRVIFHLEAAHDPELVIGKIHENGKEAGVAIVPQTPWEKAEPYCASADLIQTLAVSPGASGQKFDPAIIDKIRALRARHEECIIEADGGINLETGKACVEAGANILAAASFIFSSSDISKSIQNLKNAASA